MAAIQDCVGGSSASADVPSQMDAAADAYVGDGEAAAAVSGESSERLDSAPPVLFTDDQIMAQTNAIRAEEAQKLEFVGEKEPLQVLAAEYAAGSPIFRAKIEKLGESYGWIRRARGDGNCFFRSFMFAYLEHILNTKDAEEVARVKRQIALSKKGLVKLGYSELTFEDFAEVFEEQLDAVLPNSENSIDLDTLVARCRDQSVSDYVVMFFRFVTSGAIQERAEMFEPFILGMSDSISTVLQFCRASVEPMGEESDHIHIQALTDALEVPVRVMYLDGSTDADKSADVNHYDFIPGEETGGASPGKPKLFLLYRPGHYDIIYPKQ
eukprot:TRINITY_DN312_c0_g6_i1.p1 TRINITY_DN312_c0_g6~~TRINITY_DN312_c0_g6_i1.p1  ORF type:complete len:325 (-),score=71.53 TRINITY_DN312_c0_g6_i1:127-1101(-)